MPELQATILTQRGVFFWSAGMPAEAAASAELPVVLALGRPSKETLVSTMRPHRPASVNGYRVGLREAVQFLSQVPHTARVTDSVRVLSRVAQLALELAAQKRVVPTVQDGHSRWCAMLTRKQDRQRFEQLAGALPTCAHSQPATTSDKTRIPTSSAAVRQLLDDIVDTLYRQSAYPGTTRGWPLEFAESLRGDANSFSPRDARYQGIPNRLAAWSEETHSAGLALGMNLSLPSTDSDRFSLSFFVHPPESPDARMPLDDAWNEGNNVTISGVDHTRPAYRAMRGLARAGRIYPPLLRALEGNQPQPLSWSPTEAFEFLVSGVADLRNAGFEIALPDVFETTSTTRLHARMSIEVHDAENLPSLEDSLQFRWEVVAGDAVIEGHEFAALCAQGEPIVRFRDSWVLLDPAELAKLPKNLSQTGALSSAEALRAVLTGEHQGVRVVADQRLTLVLDALREPPVEPIPHGLQATLRPYQHQGFSWLTTLARLGLGACLADDMGLGKTIQVITHVLNRRSIAQGPTLIVCPTSVLGNWVSEFQRFAPSISVARYHGLNRGEEAFSASDVVITTYGLLVRDADLLAEVDWDVVALDEAQSIKNPDSRRAKSARRLKAKHRVAMSGTPVENRLLELWSVLQFLIPGLLGSRGAFQRNVAIPIERFGDEEAAEQLKRGVAPFLLRRVKTDPNVISDLPDKVERREWCSLTSEQATLYESVVDDYMSRIQGADSAERRGNILAMLTALKQVCNHPVQLTGEDGPLKGRSGKLEATTVLLSTILENGERALVFTQYRVMGDLLQQHLQDVFGQSVPFLHGGTAANRREALVRAFQDDADAPPILLISLRAGGTGLNLTRATNVIHYDRWWNPAVEDQATDRAFRIGQKKNVFVHKLVTTDTLEQRIDALLDDKRALADSVVGSGERLVTELDDDALRRLVALGDDARMDD